jgi:hypothetical protein
MMTTNTIQKKCPVCGHPQADILGAMTRVEINDKIEERVSYNHYRCLNSGKKHTFEVKRKGNKQEQELTEKYIKSSSIILD